MSSEAANHLVEEIQSVLNRFSMEYTISTAEVIGVLHLLAMDVANDAFEQEEEED